MTTYTVYSPIDGQIIATKESMRHFTCCVARLHRNTVTLTSYHSSEELAHKSAKRFGWHYIVLPLNVAEITGVFPAVYGTTESGKWGVVREARKIEAESTETTETTETTESTEAAETTESTETTEATEATESPESTETTESTESTGYDNIVTVMNDLFNAGKYLDLQKVDDHSDLPYVSHPSTGDAIYVTSDADTTTFYRRTVDGAVTRYTFAN